MKLTKDEQLVVRDALRDRAVIMLNQNCPDEYEAAYTLLKKFAKAYGPIVEVA